MLGEQIGELSGKTTGRRVLPSDGGGPKMETSQELRGKLLGVDVTNMVTYWAVVRPDGNLYGDGQGVFMGAGGEMASYVGTGLGVFTGPGAVSFRGSFYFQTTSPKWARLNNVSVIFESDTAANGDTTLKTWEWK